MILSSRKLVGGLFAALAVTSITLACGSSDESKFKDPNAEQPSFLGPDGGFLGGEAGDDPLGKLLESDPPAAWCGIDGGAPPAVGGTEQCPSDKNLPGCACVAPDGTALPPGAKAKCWTGTRKNRGLGQCHDGETTCASEGENRNVWGPCLGQKLPTPNATGAEACSCFSIGLWKIDNTAPCIWTPDKVTYYAYSPLPPDPAKDPYAVQKCETNDHLESGQKTPEVWSKDRLTTDCAGTFTLVYRIRVGDYKNPSPNDCILGESKTLADYQESGKEQELPALPSWNSTDSACAKKWEAETPEDKSPGYGEMIVQGGQTVRCEAVSNVPKDSEFVFNRVQYCPRICRKNDPHYQPEHPECKACALAGQGNF